MNTLGLKMLMEQTKNQIYFQMNIFLSKCLISAILRPIDWVIYHVLHQVFHWSIYL